MVSMKEATASSNLDRLEEKTNDFTEHTEQLQGASHLGPNWAF